MVKIVLLNLLFQNHCRVLKSAQLYICYLVYLKNCALSYRLRVCGDLTFRQILGTRTEERLSLVHSTLEDILQHDRRNVKFTPAVESRRQSLFLSSQNSGSIMFLEFGPQRQNLDHQNLTNGPERVILLFSCSFCVHVKFCLLFFGQIY